MARAVAKATKLTGGFSRSNAPKSLLTIVQDLWLVNPARTHGLYFYERVIQWDV